MLSICKRFECGISYAHALPGYNGKCKDLHGHNASVEVEVAGRDAKAYRTMVMDFSQLKSLVTSLLSELDHKDITTFFWLHHENGSGAEIIISRNDLRGRPVVRAIADMLPSTAEVIVQYLADKIAVSLPVGVRLIRLRVSETPDSWAEWKQEGWRA